MNTNFQFVRKLSKNSWLELSELSKGLTPAVTNVDEWTKEETGVGLALVGENFGAKQHHALYQVAKTSH